MCFDHRLRRGSLLEGEISRETALEMLPRHEAILFQTCQTIFPPRPVLRISFKICVGGLLDMSLAKEAKKALASNLYTHSTMVRTFEHV